MAGRFTRVCLALVVMSVACAPPPPVPTDALSDVPNDGTSVARTITPEGGSISWRGVTLAVPPGALAAPREIRITVTTDRVPDGYLAYSPVYRFEPAGLQFAVPASVSIQFVGDTSRAAVYWTNASQLGFDRLETTIAGDHASALVTHFSDGFVGAPAPDASALDVAADADATTMDADATPGDAPFDGTIDIPSDDGARLDASDVGPVLPSGCGAGGQPCCTDASAPCLTGLTCDFTSMRCARSGPPATVLLPGARCTSLGGCAFGYVCTSGICAPPATCTAFGSSGCVADRDCCGSADYVVCAPTLGETQNRCCQPASAICSIDADCCGTMACVAGFCVGHSAGGACASRYECQHTVSTTYFYDCDPARHVCTIVCTDPLLACPIADAATDTADGALDAFDGAADVGSDLAPDAADVPDVSEAAAPDATLDAVDPGPGTYLHTRHLCSRAIGANAAVWRVAAGLGTDFVVAGQFSGTMDLGSGPITTTDTNHIWVARIAADCTPRWVRLLPSTDTGTFSGFGEIRVVGGEVWVSGDLQGAADLGTGTLAAGAFVARLDSAGTTRWSRSVPGAYFQDLDVGPAVALGVYFTGTIDPGTGAMTAAPAPASAAGDVAVVRYELDGTPSWARQFGETISTSLYIRRVAWSPSGGLVFGGDYSSALSFGGAVLPTPASGIGSPYLVSMTASGTHVWSRGTSGRADLDDFAIDAAGNIFASGRSYAPPIPDFGGGPLPGAAGNTFLASWDAAGTYRFAFEPAPTLANVTAQSQLTIAPDGSVVLALGTSGVVDLGGGPLGLTGSYGVGVVAFTPTGGYRWSDVFVRGDNWPRAFPAYRSDGTLILAGGSSLAPGHLLDLGGGGLPAGGWFAVYRP